jgi:hypothetical protein
MSTKLGALQRPLLFYDARRDGAENAESHGCSQTPQSLVPFQAAGVRTPLPCSVQNVPHVLRVGGMLFFLTSILYSQKKKLFTLNSQSLFQCAWGIIMFYFLFEWDSLGLPECRFSSHPLTLQEAGAWWVLLPPSLLCVRCHFLLNS